MTDTSDSETSVSKKNHICNIKGCNAAFSRPNKLLIHLRKHTGERPFVCDEPNCTKTYTNNSHLRRHKQTSHAGKIDHTVMCSFEGCGVILANKYSLKKHCNRKHNSEKYNFKCQECGQGFHRKKLLQQHSYLHTGEAAFSCDKCNMSFMTSYHLNKHKKYHKEYKCSCGEVFQRWSSIITHRKVCKKPRFVCDVCKKAFSHLGNYKSHKLTHTDDSEKNVSVCPYSDCNRTYLYKKNLIFHINSFHHKTEERFKCTYPRCHVALKTKRLLRLHLQRHYKLKQNKKRKDRKDKGTTKKSVLSVLLGKYFDAECNKNRKEECEEEKREDCDEETREECKEVQVPNIEKSTEFIDPLLEECDLVLSLLNEKLVNGS